MEFFDSADDDDEEEAEEDYVEIEFVGDGHLFDVIYL